MLIIKLSRDKTEYLNTSFAFNVDDDETDLPWNFDSAKKALMTEDDRLVFEFTSCLMCLGYNHQR